MGEVGLTQNYTKLYKSHTLLFPIEIGTALLCQSREKVRIFSSENERSIHGCSSSSFQQVGAVEGRPTVHLLQCPGTLLPSPRPPTKYLINGRNCDTISNEPFIEPHLDNPEIGSQAAVGGGLVPNQRIPARQRSCITHTLPPAATSTHLSFVKRAKL